MASMCRPWWLEPSGGYCVSALVAGAQRWLIGDWSPAVASMCQPWWLVPSGGYYVSASVAGAQWWLLCVSLGGWSPAGS